MSKRRLRTKPGEMPALRGPEEEGDSGRDRGGVASEVRGKPESESPKRCENSLSRMTKSSS